MSRIVGPLAAISLWLIFAITLSIGLPLMKAERQAGINDRVAPLIIPPKPIPIGFLFVVTSTGDGDNMASGAVCDDGTGNCTLRAAIEVANNNVGDDGIRFNIPTTDPGYDASTGRWTINLTMPLPDLSTNISITGPGADKLTVQRSSSAAQFRIFNVTTTGTVTLSDMTIANGVVQNGFGGGIFNNGGDTLNLSNITLKNNFAGQGGGIYSQGGTINVTSSILTGNSANIAGGGIYSQCFSTCMVTLTNCTVSGNFGAGGGIFNTCGSGSNTLNVINSTVSGNSGRLPGGGGIFNSVSSGSGHSTANITNSTIAGNFNNLNDADGGGISADFSTVNLTNSTVSGNSTTRMGGGIFSSTLAIINVKNSIIGVNSALVSAPDVSGSFISQGNNLVGARDGSTGFTSATDHTGTVAGPLDVKLDPAGLQNNGGPTQTIALRSGSLAINNADPAAAPARDQRGFARTGLPDIGSFEFGGTIPVSLGNISTRGEVGTGDNVMIGGFIISGTGNKTVLLRAIGPTLSNPPINLAGTLQDPTLSLFNSSGGMIISNDNWADATNAQSIDPSLRPSNSAESAILISLAPGAYTAIVRGANGGTGIGLVEVFDLDATVPSKLSNISTRGLVETGDGVMIGGFIVKGPDSDKVVVRAIGPSLASPPINLTNVLQNPTLSLFDANGMMFASNDDWRSTQEADIIATGLQPTNDAESAIVTTLTPGNYTAIVRGAGGSTGIALVEVYGLN